MFTPLSSVTTNINFENKLVEDAENNIITYEYFYNGGGVAAGDFNNDGLIDLYFTANLLPNKLYLNKGNFAFEDVTSKAGVAGKQGWKTGVSVADVNGDGFLDIYVCYSGDVEREHRRNQLFINNGFSPSHSGEGRGEVTFTDMAAAYGVADEGHTTQAAFFDYDNDGDLDLYVLNHNVKNLRNFDAAFVKKMVDADAGDRLYRNDNNKFTNVTAEAGIISNPLGYGLGLSIADINNDGWPDIYVSNDYVEEDYLYLNNKNGSFTECLKSSFGHLSNFSMGVDVADINNDGLADIFTLDMLPEDNRRQKLLYAPDNYELYNNTVQNGFYHQLMRNMLQVNNGDGSFSEVGQVAGISNTDWSWAALFADFNNDGQKDLFITNGYGRDMINRDFMKFYANERLKHLQGKTDSKMFQMLQGIKGTPLHNYIYQNQGGFIFKNQSTDWGFDELNFSHGAAYADLDNDGDLDLIVNKMNQEAGIYKNNTIENKSGGNFLKIVLKAAAPNTNAIGAKVQVQTQAGTYTLQNFPVHGFQSAMQIPLHFAFPDNKIVAIKITWPDGSQQIIEKAITINTQIEITKPKNLPVNKTVIEYTKPIFSVKNNAINFLHQETGGNDFKIQPLMPNMISYAGPRIAKGDINNDGKEDFFICGAKNQSGKMFVQQANGSFVPIPQPNIETDAAAEDCAAVFFDADNDGDLDLYVVSGGYAINKNDTLLADRLYINTNGNFVKDKARLPKFLESGSCVVPIDFDNDGDIDLFVGSRCVPENYPLAPKSYLLQNDGKGFFKDVTQLFAKDFENLGMITDAIIGDVNGDGKNELIVCGEWMPIQVFSFSKGIATNISKAIFDKPLLGWWNRLQLADLDNDGKQDLIAGNWGLNSQIKTSQNEPATLYYGDFDGNGFIDPLLCYYIQGKSYPMASRDELTDQMVSLRQKFPTYDSYADATIDDILTPEQMATAKVLTVNHLQTTWFKNFGGKFVEKTLPIQANIAPVYAIQVDDFNNDGNPDILLLGDIEQTRIKIGKIDANYGVLLEGDGKGNFNYVPQTQSGLQIKGSVKDAVKIKNAEGKNVLLIGINNKATMLLEY